MKDGDKIAQIAAHFSAILRYLGVSPESEMFLSTPQRWARMVVEELCASLSEPPLPTMTTMANHGYASPVVQTNIPFRSLCEHHFLPFFGQCHIAYIPRNEILGLSKWSRLLHHLMNKPQLQERLTIELVDSITGLLGIEDLAVVIDATHLCVSLRGPCSFSARTRTVGFRGKFNEPSWQALLWSAIAQDRPS